MSYSKDYKWIGCQPTSSCQQLTLISTMNYIQVNRGYPLTVLTNMIIWNLKITPDILEYNKPCNIAVMCMRVYSLGGILDYEPGSNLHLPHGKFYYKKIF